MQEPYKLGTLAAEVKFWDGVQRGITHKPCFKEALVQLPSVSSTERKSTLLSSIPFKADCSSHLCDLTHFFKMNQQKNDKKKNTKKFHQYRKWSFGSLNIRTGKENDDGAKIYSVTKEMSKTGLQFLLLQEVRWKGVDSKLI